MIDKISPRSQIQAVTPTAPKPPTQQTTTTAKPVEDSVRLSPQALAAASKSSDHTVR